MQKISPFLWFNDQAEAAAKFYTSIFSDSEINSISRYGNIGPGPRGKVMIVSFQLEGQNFTALNGGPQFNFTPALSLFVNCETQEEVDHLWDSLLAGGKSLKCGWVQDKYGVAWQIIPKALVTLMSDPDPVKSKQVLAAMMKMDKIDIKVLQAAHDQK